LVQPYQPSEDPPPGFPFCSPKCKQIDLGKWFFGGYRISSPLSPEDEELEMREEEAKEETEDE